MNSYKYLRRIKSEISNLFRWTVRLLLPEKFVIFLCEGRGQNQGFVRLLPRPRYYKKGSWRYVEFKKVRLKLDISDYIDWFVYFKLRNLGWEKLIERVERKSNVLDVGGNVGYVSLLCADKASEGSVTAFEPVKSSYLRAIENTRNVSNIRLYNVGVGRKPGQLAMQQVDVNNTGRNRVSTNASSQALDYVDIICLDNWIAENPLATVDVIKIDVEGYEMEVLKGADNLIRTFSPVLFIEVIDAMLNDYGSSVEELFEWLTERNYTITDIYGRVMSSSAMLKSQHLDVFAFSKK